MKQFRFICYSSDDFGSIGFVLLNKCKIKKLFEENSSLLNSTFGEEADLIHFFQQPPLKTLPKANLQSQFHHAFGVLLGYGNKNSSAFGKKNEMINYLSHAPLNLELLNNVDLKNILQEKAWSVREELCESTNYTHNQICDATDNLNFLRSNYKFTPATQRETHLSPFDLPGFLAFEDDEETQTIQRSYDNVRSLIVEILYSENFLEKVLLLLTS